MQAVQRAADAPYVPAADVGVDACRLNALVPQELLNVANVSAVFQQMGGRAVIASASGSTSSSSGHRWPSPSWQIGNIMLTHVKHCKYR